MFSNTKRAMCVWILVVLSLATSSAQGQAAQGQQVEQAPRHPSQARTAAAETPPAASLDAETELASITREQLVTAPSALEGEDCSPTANIRSNFLGALYAHLGGSNVVSLGRVVSVMYYMTQGIQYQVHAVCGVAYFYSGSMTLADETAYST